MGSALGSALGNTNSRLKRENYTAVKAAVPLAKPAKAEEDAKTKKVPESTLQENKVVKTRARGLYAVAYAIFVIAAVVAVVEDAGQDDWIALATNGALGVTAFYAMNMQRVDLAVIAIFTLCTSVVWHSSGKFKELDGFASRYMAYYAFGTTAFSASVIGPPMLIVALLLSYEGSVNELYVFIPLVTLLLFYKWLNGNVTYRLLLAVGVGIGAMVCYNFPVWHAAWHVLGAVTVALTIETPKRQARMYFQNFKYEQPA